MEGQFSDSSPMGMGELTLNAGGASSPGSTSATNSSYTACEKEEKSRSADQVSKRGKGVEAVSLPATRTRDSSLSE